MSRPSIVRKRRPRPDQPVSAIDGRIQLSRWQRHRGSVASLSVTTLDGLISCIDDPDDDSTRAYQLVDQLVVFVTAATARPVLETLLKDRDEAVRRVAMRAIEYLDELESRQAG
jgi:hypothetical protein